MSGATPSSKSGISRRRLLGSIGVGGAVLAAPTAAFAADQERRRRRDGEGEGGDAGDGSGGALRQFSRMFPDLEPFAESTEETRDAVRALGASGGIMDGGFEPVEDVPENPDHASMPSGYTFTGQFIDHDLTRDAGSTLGQPTSLDRSTNLRIPRFDLDSVYGGGPDASPQLYEDDDRQRLRVESGGRFEDLPRDETMTALIGDDRNDENLIVSQLHAGFLRFHNAVLEGVRADGFAGGDAFREARRLVRWHYQWAVVHDVLPAFVGQAMVDSVLGGDVRGGQPSGGMPVEFQTAAYRFGHSIIRPAYRVNATGDDGEDFTAPIFDTDLDPAAPDPDDLSGGHRAPRRFVDWDGFFDFGTPPAFNAKRIDTRLSGPLMNLPLRVVDSGRAEGPGPTSLAARNLLRHLTWGVPSGQAVAAALGEAPLAAGDLADLDQFGAGLTASTPLFFYVLREADVVADGVTLGPVGGRIVAEVFLGLLLADDDSYLGTDPDWTPTLPRRDSARGFTMADLLTVAGVGPDGRAAGSTGVTAGSDAPVGLPVDEPVDVPVADSPGRGSPAPDGRRPRGRELRSAGAPRNT